MKIIIAGFSASGKTSVGRILADILGFKFFDLDELIFLNFDNKQASEIFVKFGEKLFRKTETTEFTKLLKEEESVISLGGATLLQSENVDLLKKYNAILVRLDTSPEVLLDRLKENIDHRPLASKVLQDKNPKLALIKEMEKRYSGYSNPDISISTDYKNPQEVAKELAVLLKNKI